MRDKDTTLGDVIKSFIFPPIVLVLFMLFLLFPFEMATNWLNDWLRSLPVWILIPVMFLGGALIGFPLFMLGAVFFLSLVHAPMLTVFDFFRREHNHPRQVSERVGKVLYISGVAAVGLNYAIVVLMVLALW